MVNSMADCSTLPYRVHTVEFTGLKHNPDWTRAKSNTAPPPTQFNLTFSQPKYNVKRNQEWQECWVESSLSFIAL